MYAFYWVFVRGAKRRPIITQQEHTAEEAVAEAAATAAPAAAASVSISFQFHFQNYN